ncbi:MAG: hypothetical protein IT222_01195 [Crocinitomix sp.]|nr:hypothetical protein [Crocinitomix sp.]
MLISIMVSSCFKNQEYPVEPMISDPSFTLLGDSAILNFSFTDGDGDIGLDPGDTLSPYEPDSFYYYNLYIDYYEKKDVGGWQRGRDLFGDSIVFEYRIKTISVKGKSKAIKGTIEVNMKIFNSPFSTDSDTVRYGIRLIDRALNISNTIETSEVVIN